MLMGAYTFNIPPVCAVWLAILSFWLCEAIRSAGGVVLQEQCGAAHLMAPRAVSRQQPPASEWPDLKLSAVRQSGVASPVDTPMPETFQQRVAPYQRVWHLPKAVAGLPQCDTNSVGRLHATRVIARSSAPVRPRGHSGSSRLSAIGVRFVQWPDRSLQQLLQFRSRIWFAESTEARAGFLLWNQVDALDTASVLKRRRRRAKRPRKFPAGAATLRPGRRAGEGARSASPARPAVARSAQVAMLCGQPLHCI
jgi:hypothetical protein